MGVGPPVLRRAFSLKIPDEALREVETVADVAAQIEARLKADGRLEG